ncbi:MAG: SGNH/GDSL hydrolase family protein [Lentisphaeria bacterium]|nr:SGNH/GDSL hydrolase family protein [Lentisphaeria bacterium]
MSCLIKPNETVLFQGDSITDAGRSRENDSDLGRGYANHVAAWFSASHPESRVQFLNRGVSGNRVRDLRVRWDLDCIDLKPDWVSIMIGINDTWRLFSQNDPTSADAYAQDYHAILSRCRDELDARVVILEPFVLPHPEDRVAWRVDLDPKIQAVRALAREFDAVYVPLDGMLAAASVIRECEFWAADGVHPTQAGHAFIAKAWLAAVGAL